MKKLITILTILFLLPGVAVAGVISDGSLTVSATAQAITSTIPSDAASALITIESGNVRVGFKTAPTATTGHLLYDGDTLEITNRHDVSSCRIILDTGSASATVRYSISDGRDN